VGRPILQRLQEIIRDTIQQGVGHHEEYAYLEVLDEFYDDIQRGYGDYQQTVHNIIKPVENLVYVYHNIVMKYYYMGYDRECEDVCRAMISSYDEGLPEPNMDLYVRVWCVRYLSMMRHDAVRGEEFGNRIRASIKTHPLFAHHFYELKYLIGMEGFQL
jgi:hypothetical protein